MKMINEKFETSHGKHRLYTVSSMGPGRGFGAVDRLHNCVVTHPFWTRDDAWEYLPETDA